MYNGTEDFAFTVAFIGSLHRKLYQVGASPTAKQLLNPFRCHVDNFVCQDGASTANILMKVMTFKMCPIHLETILIGIELQVSIMCTKQVAR